MSLVSLGAMAVMSKVNSYGKAFSAAYNVGSRLDQMAFLAVQSLTNAVTAFVGQNTGAKKPERVRRGVRAAAAMSAVWCLAMTALLTAMAPQLVGAFSPEADVIRSGVSYLRCIMPFYVLFGTFYILNGAMRGAGDSVFPMVNVLLSLILVRVPVVYLLANRFGPGAMYYGIGIGWCVGFTLCVIYYLSGRWKRHGSLAEAEP